MMIVCSLRCARGAGNPTTNGEHNMIIDEKIERRQFLKGTLGAAGVAVATPAMRGLSIISANGRISAPLGMGGYGPLMPTPDMRDGVERIALPKGFSYRSFSHAGEMMSDGNLVPIAHDGMGVYNMRNGTFRLVRNHEDRNSPGNGTTATDANSYDSLGGGGNTTLVINPFTRKLERDFISLSGTIVNCAGGVTPWDSWITCEETNAGTPSGWEKQHGYCFDIPVDADETVPAIALPEMGRFSHEAVCVDPDTWIVYETEDNGSNSGFYRFIPKKRGVLKRGGRLQMLAVEDLPKYDTRTGQFPGQKLRCTWVDIDEPNPPGTGSSDVFNQGFGAGGARFARLEGCWFGNDAVYFNATSGGDAGAGQVWEYRPSRRHGGTLTLIFESPSAAVLDAPDNIAVSPNDALLLCEDGGGDQYLRGVTLDGEIFDFALNLQTDHEWAGATFAVADPSWNDRKIRGRHRPLGNKSDRTTLFVNRQGSTSGGTPPTEGNEGITFAIWGPWHKGAL
jgi:secreted PhoX family phosphatase